MAWPTRSSRLAHYGGILTAGPIFYPVTVPAGKTWLIKDWMVFNGEGSVRSYALWVKVDNVPIIVWHSGNVSASSSVVGQNRSIVAHAGEGIGISISANGSVQFYMSGAKLGP